MFTNTFIFEIEYKSIDPKDEIIIKLTKELKQLKEVLAELYFEALPT